MLKKTQNAVYSLVSSRTRHLSDWNTYIKTRHLSTTLIAEPDTSLEHLQQNQTPVWTVITLILILALDIQFLRIPFLSTLPLACNHPLPSEFLLFACSIVSRVFIYASNKPLCGTLIINIGKNSICACYFRQIKTSFGKIR